MRTAPVEELTQAETLLETGAAIAAVPTESKQKRTPGRLREIMSTSEQVVYCSQGKRRIVSIAEERAARPIPIRIQPPHVHCERACRGA